MLIENPAPLDQQSELTESLSMAFLILLENLTPPQRAALLLKDVFDYDYLEIATIIDTSVANCRQIVHRARQYLMARPRRFEVAQEAHKLLLTHFVEAINGGDFNALIDTLAEDITFLADDGGKAFAPPQSLHGVDTVAKFILAIMPKLPDLTRFDLVTLNGQPGLIGYFSHTVAAGLIFDIWAHQIETIYLMGNPSKLQCLQSVAR